MLFAFGSGMSQDASIVTSLPETPSDVPWQHLGLTAADVNPVPSMMGGEEGLYLYWLARDARVSIAWAKAAERVRQARARERAAAATATTGGASCV